VRNLIISFAIAFTMTSLFTAMLGAQAGIFINAARGPSDAPLVDVRTPIGANVGANHAALGADHPASPYGWTQGQNVRIEYRYSGGRQDTVSPLVAELVGSNPDVLIAWSPPMCIAMRNP